MCYGGLPFLCFLVNVRVVYESYDDLRNHSGLRDSIDYAKVFKKFEKLHFAPVRVVC